jgi:hypothetical protein
VLGEGSGDWAMRSATIVGIVLIVLGVFALGYQGMSYTRREKVIDLGPVRAETERREVTLPPILGGAAIVGGAILLLASARRRV